MPHDHPTVLVAVEDAELRRALVQGLRQDGYLVLEAADARGVLDTVRTHSRSIHLMLLHVSIGHKLKSAISPYRPKAKILFFSDEGKEQLQDVLTPEIALTKVREFFNS